MKKSVLLRYIVIVVIFAGLVSSVIVLKNTNLLGFTILESFAQEDIFYDDFESGGLDGWSLSHAAGAVDWIASTTSPYQGSYHAFGRPIDTDDPACTMERTISTLNYNNINFSYYRKLNLGTALHTFRAKWYDGSTWTAVEDVTGTIADSNYVSQSFLLPSSANNNPNFAIKFECTEGTTTKDCNVDNVNISGNEIITDTTPPTINVVYPLAQNYNLDVSELNYTYSDANPGECWYSTDNGITNSSFVTAGENFTSVISAEGSNTWLIYCNDSIGNENLDSVIFFKDTIIPDIEIDFPSNDSSHIYSNLEINYTSSDLNLDSCWWTSDNGLTNNSVTCGNNITGVTWSEGENVVIVWINDSSTNENQTSVTFSIDSILPFVSIVLPQDGAAYGYNESIDLNYSVSDVNLGSCWYNVDNGNNVSLGGCANTTFDVPGDGNYVILVYANDSFSNENSDSSSFSVQVGAPTIILNSPVDSYLDSQTVTFSYTPIDVDLDYCELWGDFTGSFSLNQTESSPTSGSENTFSLTLPDGTYLWNVRCEDDLGNSAFNGNKTFYVDTLVPNLSLTQPTGAKTSRSVTASWTVSDLNLGSCWYNVHRGETVEIANTSVNCSLDTTSFNVTVDASFIFNFYVNDSAGNSNSSSLSFSVDTSTSPPPSGDTGGGGGGGSSGGSAVSKDKLEITKIPDLIVDAGENKKMVLHVQNIGKDFLNDCKIIGEGENAEWISSTDVKGLSAGQKEDFIFTLSIPDKLGTGSYEVVLSLRCQEYNQSTSFFAEIIEKKLAVDLVNIERVGKDKIKVIYSLVELSDIEQEVEIEIILFGLENERIVESTEKKKIEASSTNEFEAVLEIPDNLEGSFNLLINAISETSSTFVQEEVILGSSKIGGLAILDTKTRDIIFSVILVIVFLVFAILIVRRILKLRKLKKIKGRKVAVEEKS